MSEKKRDRNTELLSDYMDGMTPAALSRKHQIAPGSVQTILENTGGPGVFVMFNTKVHNYRDCPVPAKPQHISVPDGYHDVFNQIHWDDRNWETVSFRRLAHRCKLTLAHNNYGFLELVPKHQVKS